MGLWGYRIHDGRRFLRRRRSFVLCYYLVIILISQLAR